MSEKLQKARRDVQMIAAQARQMVIAVAGPLAMGETVQRGLERASRRLGFTYTRTYNIYLQRAKVSAAEWVRLNEEAAELAQREKARREALHELDLVARDAVARFAVASHSALAGPADGLGDAKVEPAAEQGGARPDLLNKYDAG